MSGTVLSYNHKQQGYVNSTRLYGPGWTLDQKYVFVSSINERVIEEISINFEILIYKYPTYLIALDYRRWTKYRVELFRSY